MQAQHAGQLWHDVSARVSAATAAALAPTVKSFSRTDLPVSIGCRRELIWPSASTLPVLPEGELRRWLTRLDHNQPPAEQAALEPSLPNGDCAGVHNQQSAAGRSPMCFAATACSQLHWCNICAARRRRRLQLQARAPSRNTTWEAPVAACTAQHSLRLSPAQHSTAQQAQRCSIRSPPRRTKVSRPANTSRTAGF